MSLPGPAVGVLGVMAKSRDMSSHTTAALTWDDLTHDELWVIYLFADWRQSEPDAHMWEETHTQSADAIRSRLGDDALEKTAQWAVSTLASSVDLVNIALDRFPNGVLIGPDGIAPAIPTDPPAHVSVPRIAHKALLEQYEDVRQLMRAAGLEAIAERTHLDLTIVQRVARSPMKAQGGHYSRCWEAAEAILWETGRVELTPEEEAAIVDPSTTPADNRSSGQPGQTTQDTGGSTMTETPIETPGPEFVAPEATPAPEAEVPEAPAPEAPEAEAPAAKAPKSKRVTKRDGAERAAQLTTARGAKAKVYALTKDAFDAKVDEHGGDLDATVKAILAEAGIELTA